MDRRLLFPAYTRKVPPSTIVHRWRAGCILLALILTLCVQVSGSEGLTILVMPTESAETSAREVFTKPDEATNLFSHLVIDNPEDAWESLGIGYHHCLCRQLDNFARNNLSQPVHVRFISWDGALVNLIAFGKSCDVLQVPSTWTAYLADQGILARWDTLNSNDYPLELLKSCKVEGQDELYAVPWHLDLRVLIYRKDLTSDPDELATFKGFAKCLARRVDEMKTTEKGSWRAPFGVGLGRDWDILHSVFAYFCQGKILEKRWLGWYGAFNKELPRKGVRELWHLAQQDRVLFVTPDTARQQNVAGALVEALRNGKCDAIIGSPQMRRALEGIPDILAVPLPQFGSEPPYAFLGGSHLGLSQAARRRGNKGDAEKLIRFLTGLPAQVELAEQTVALPARRDALERYLHSHPKWAAFGAALGWARTYPSIPRWARDIETPLVLDHFYYILQSMQRKEKWPIVASQLDAAVKDVNPPFPWKWAAIAGVVLVAMGGGGLWIYERHRRRVAEREVRDKINASVRYMILLRKLMTDLFSSLFQAEEQAGKSAEQARRDIAKVLIRIDEAMNGASSKIEDLRTDVSAVGKRLGDLTSILKTLSGIRDTVNTLPETAENVEELLETVDRLEEEIRKIASALTPKTLELSDIILNIQPYERNPMFLTMEVVWGTDLDQPILGTALLVSPTSLYVAEAMRNNGDKLSCVCYTWATGNKDAKLENMGRTIRKECNPVLLSTIKNILKKANPKPIKLADDKLQIIEVTDKGKFSMYPTRIPLVNSSILESRKLIESRPNAQDIANAIQKDIGNIDAWEKATALPETSSVVICGAAGEAHQDWELILKSYCIRHMQVGQIFKQMSTQRDPIIPVGETTRAKDDYYKKATVLLAAIKQFGQTLDDMTAPTNPSPGFEDWIDCLKDWGEYEEPLCIASMAFDTTFKQPQGQWVPGVLTNIQDTSWYKCAKQRILDAKWAEFASKQREWNANIEYEKAREAAGRNNLPPTWNGNVQTLREIVEEAKKIRYGTRTDEAILFYLWEGINKGEFPWEPLMVSFPLAMSFRSASVSKRICEWICRKANVAVPHDVTIKDAHAKIDELDKSGLSDASTNAELLQGLLNNNQISPSKAYHIASDLLSGGIAPTSLQPGPQSSD